MRNQRANIPATYILACVPIGALVLPLQNAESGAHVGGSEIEENAKAVQEAAKAAGKAIDLADNFGGFLSKIFGGPLEQVSGIVEDKLMAHRAVRRLRLVQRYNEICSEMNLPLGTKQVSLKFGVPLITAATLEDDDTLQDMYARLLANATNPNGTVQARRAFVTILQDFGPLEALLMDRIYHAPSGPPDSPNGVRTSKLPEAYAQDDTTGRPTAEVELALWNLTRLGCVEPAGTWGGGSTVAMVTMTELGRAFIEACTTVSGRAAPAPSNEDASWSVKWTSNGEKLA